MQNENTFVTEETGEVDIDTFQEPQRFYPLRDPDDPYKSTLIPVSEEFYQTMQHAIWRTLRKMKDSGNCTCPRKQLWTCDANCDVCPYCVKNQYVSLDAPIAGTDGLTIADTVADDSADIAEALIYIETLQALMDEVEKLDPDGKRICRLVSEGKSERAIAEILGIPRKTYTYRRDKLFAKLREALNDYI